jgi:prepilin-type N-terminal cleavage/methylation domain-containing protein
MNKKLLKGFTLIELLIVMAILGVLAVVVLVAINPVQQLARTRDAGRKSGVTQIGHAAEAFYTSHGGTYMADSNAWLSTLSNAGELASIPQQIVGSAGGYTACAGNVVSGWCYDVTATLDNAVIFTKLESQSEQSKCTTATDTPYFVFSTIDGRGGLWCGAAEPGAGVNLVFNAVQ